MSTTDTLEAIALADDRASAIGQLVAGTEDRDYWRAIDAQHRGELSEVDDILKRWTHGHSKKYERLVRRQKLLLASTDLEKHQKKLVDLFGCQLNHQPEAETAAIRYPTTLAPSTVDERRLVEQGEGRHGLEGLSQIGLRLLTDPLKLDAIARRQWLERLDRPSGISNIVEVIALDLADRNSRGFGSLAIHNKLTASELEKLLELRPEILADPARVTAVVSRLRPPEHESWQDGTEEAIQRKIGYLDQVLSQVLAPLPVAFAAHRAAVLYHRLACDVRTGRFDRARLCAYLSLGRTGPGALPQGQSAAMARGSAVTKVLHSSFFSALGLPQPPRDDLDVVRPYVRALLAEVPDASALPGTSERRPADQPPDATLAALSDVLDKNWLLRERAEARLLAGSADAKWAAVLGADATAELHEQVVLQLLPTNRARYRKADGQVSLEVEVKNVPRLRVRVFRLNVPAFFDAHGGRDVDAHIDLDGLAAGHEEELLYAPEQFAPVLAHRETIALPACAEPGTYVVELIGGGLASRALLRRGDLRCATRPSAAGSVVDVFDEDGVRVPATLRLGGREYEAGADGSICLPFSTRPGVQPVLVLHGSLAVVSRAELRAEQPSFSASWLVERQGLVPGETARALVRLELAIGGVPVSLALLQDAHVEITTVDRRDVTVKQRQPLARLTDSADCAFEFAVPADAAHVHLAAGARVRVLSEQRTVELRAEHSVAVSTMHAEQATSALYLRPCADGLRLALLGKSGEPRARRAIALRLRARVLTSPVSATLMTDENGEVCLGELCGVSHISATVAGGGGDEGGGGSATYEFDLSELEPVAPRQQVSLAGAGDIVVLTPTSRVGALASSGSAGPARTCSVIEVRSGVPVRDFTSHARAEPGRIVIAGLPAGRYEVCHGGLWDGGLLLVAELVVLPSGASVARGWASMHSGLLEVSARRPTSAAVSLTPSGGVRVRLSDWTARTRVHVIATALAPAPAADLRLPASTRPPLFVPGALALATYLSGRDIGEEYRYVLDRQKQPRRAGVLLDKPSLLLNPQALRTTSTGVKAAKVGGAYAPPSCAMPAAPRCMPGFGSSAARCSASAYGGDRRRGGGRNGAIVDASFPSYDFLAAAPVLLANLVPTAGATAGGAAGSAGDADDGDDGVLTISAADLGGAAHVVVLVVDPSATSHHSLALARPAAGASAASGGAAGGAPLAVRDLRLPAPLPLDKHVREDRRLLSAPAGTVVALSERATSRAELVDSVEKAYRLLCALSHDSTLASWDFLGRWPALPEAERLRLYGRHACHELSLFIYCKDRPLFDKALRPFIADKLQPDLIDLWLVGSPETARFLAPHRLARCNALELALLALRHPEAAPAIRRRLSDSIELTAPDPAADDRLVDAIIAGGALAADGGLGGALAECEEEAEACAFSSLGPADPFECVPSTSSASSGGSGSGACFGGPPPPPPPAAPGCARSMAPKKKCSAPASRGRSERELEAEDYDMCCDEEEGSCAKEMDEPPPDDLVLGVAQRALHRPTALYRTADTTKEWAETGWHELGMQGAGAECIPPARLWLDLASHREKGEDEAGSAAPFLSPHLADAAVSLPAAMAALAFLDLPFATTQPPALATAGAGATVTTRSHSIAAVIEIAQVDGPPSSQVLIGQSYFRADDRFAWEGSERVDKVVQGQMLCSVVYVCQIVVTNPTSRRQQLAVLHQIPQGAIAVGGGVATCTRRCGLEPFQSTTIEYAFYWPREGTFAHYGAQVTRAAGGSGAALLAAVEARSLSVVATPSSVDADSWAVISQRASLDELCAFLRERNLGRVELSAIAWRCRERAAFARILDALSQRRLFDSKLWAYSLLHADRPRAQEWLAALASSGGLGDVGPAFGCGLVAWEPCNELELGSGRPRGGRARAYEHLEYGPLLNARAHQLGETRTILNEGLAEQWRRFLEQLAHRPAPRYEDELAASHYLFAMDRHDEAVARLARLDDGRVLGGAAGARACLQRDYMRAYADIVSGNLEGARARMQPHRSHPVERWRSRFAALAALLDEASGAASAAPSTGGAASEADADSREQALADAASRTPTIAVRVDAAGECALLEHSGPLEKAELRFYKMDLELLFSRQPFFGADSSRFTFIAPGRSDEVPLASTGPTRWPLPAELRTHSLVIEAVAAGARATCTHFAHELSITVTAPYGRLQVRHAATGAARVAAYVKCFARYRAGGGVAFFKDGYTDICGRFDYATLSTDDLDRVERFALLIVDDKAGSTVVEAAPPAR